MSFLKPSRTASNEEDSKLYCPYCNYRFFWTRPVRKMINEAGSATVKCRNCSKAYKLMRQHSESEFLVSVSCYNKEEE